MSEQQQRGRDGEVKRVMKAEKDGGKVSELKARIAQIGTVKYRGGADVRSSV
jgi:hypothetical protein